MITFYIYLIIIFLINLKIKYDIISRVNKFMKIIFFLLFIYELYCFYHISVMSYRIFKFIQT